MVSVSQAGPPGGATRTSTRASEPLDEAASMHRPMVVGRRHRECETRRMLPPAVHASLVADDATALHLVRWPHPAPRGLAVIVHGLGEHHGRYSHVAAQLHAEGHAVLAHDQRGHGRSGGARGDLPRPDALLADLALVVDHARTLGDGPLLLVGHSLGGLVAARFVAGALQDSAPRWARPVDALLLSSPALDAGLNPAQALLLAVMRRIAPHLAVGNGLKPEWLSRDARVVAAYRADPLVHDRITAALAAFIVDAGRTVLALAPRWRVPTLLLWAGADRCVAPAGSARFAAAAPPAMLSAQAFPALRHELFNEPEQAAVFAALHAWLAHRRA